MQESERIKKLAKHYGSQANFAKVLGVGQSNVTNWIKRGTLPSGAIKLIGQKCPDVSIGWLTTGKGEMLVETPGHAGSNVRAVQVALDVLGRQKGKKVRFKTSEDGKVIVEYDDGTTCNAASRRIAKKILEQYGVSLGRTGKARPTVNYVRKANVGSVCVEALLEDIRRKKDDQPIGKRRINEILNEALDKCHSATINKEGGLSITPYNIEEGSNIAVVPVKKEAEAYIKVGGFGMSPTINDGDVIGITSTDWFEQFSDTHIYMVELMTGEVVVRRIVPPSKDSDLIKLVSDNPNEEERSLYRRDIKDIKRVIFIGKNL